MYEMEKQVQFSVFVVNDPGSLSQIFREFGGAKANIIAVAMMDSMEHSVLRLIVQDAGKARLIFRDLNIPVSETDVLAVSLPNRPGAAADLCDRLAASHVNIGYMYCTTGTRGGKTLVILKVPDIKKAMKVLNSKRSTRRDMKVKLRRPRATTRR